MSNQNLAGYDAVLSLREDVVNANLFLLFFNNHFCIDHQWNIVLDNEGYHLNLPNDDFNHKLNSPNLICALTLTLKINYKMLPSLAIVDENSGTLVDLSLGFTSGKIYSGPGLPQSTLTDVHLVFSINMGQVSVPALDMNWVTDTAKKDFDIIVEKSTLPPSAFTVETLFLDLSQSLDENQHVHYDPQRSKNLPTGNLLAIFDKLLGQYFLHFKQTYSHSLELAYGATVSSSGSAKVPLFQPTYCKVFASWNSDPKQRCFNYMMMVQNRTPPPSIASFSPIPVSTGMNARYSLDFDLFFKTYIVGKIFPLLEKHANKYVDTMKQGLGVAQLFVVLGFEPFPYKHIDSPFTMGLPRYSVGSCLIAGLTFNNGLEWASGLSTYALKSTIEFSPSASGEFELQLKLGLYLEGSINAYTLWGTKKIASYVYVGDSDIHIGPFGSFNIVFSIRFIPSVSDGEIQVVSELVQRGNIATPVFQTYPSVDIINEPYKNTAVTLASEAGTFMHNYDGIVPINALIKSSLHSISQLAIFPVPLNYAYKNTQHIKPLSVMSFDVTYESYSDLKGNIYDQQ